MFPTSQLKISSDILERALQPFGHTEAKTPYIQVIRICVIEDGVENDIRLAVGSFDTGGPQNLISRKLVKHVLQQPINDFGSGPQPVLKLLDGSLLYAIGTIDLRWRSDDLTQTAPKFLDTRFLVTEIADPSFDIIVGSETCYKEGIISGPALGAAGHRIPPATPVTGEDLIRAQQQNQKKTEEDQRQMQEYRKKKEQQEKQGQQEKQER
ncbi:MAG: hypothetical protein Q9165_003199 [Trypethelium subeluteriae]